MHRVSSEAAAQALAGLGLSTGVDMDTLWAAADLVDEHIGDEPVSPVAPRIAVRAAQRKLPVGLVGALDSQLRTQAAGDRLDEVLDEVDKVRIEVGSPPLAAPIGNIVASQALLNVLTANRYSTMVDELRDLVEGRFGRTPAAVDPALVRAVELIGNGRDDDPTGRPRRARGRTPRGSRRARRSCCCSRSSARRPSRCSARSASARAATSRSARGASTRRAPRRSARSCASCRRPASARSRSKRTACASACAARPSTAYAPGSRRAGCAGRRGGAAAGRAARRLARPRREPDGRHLLPRARAGRRGLRRGRRRRRRRPDALHSRGDEADERGEGRGRGRRARDPRRRRRAGRVRPAALRARTGQRPTARRGV